MFGFVKELFLIGVVSNAVGKVVNNLCGVNFIKEMTVKQQNGMAEKTIKVVEQVRGEKLKEVNESNFDDIVVVGLLNLADGLGSTDAMKHQIVLMGLMKYLNNAFNQNANISQPVLTVAKDYLDEYGVK